MRRRWLGLGCALVMTVVTGRAGAQEKDKEAKGDVAAAQVLFEEGRKLLKQGLVDAACPKFAESHRLDPALGSLLNLASCHEEQGRIAAAWGEFRDAEQEAAREGDKKRQLFAAQKVKALEPRLPKLKIVAVDPPPGLVVKRDDVELSSASFGVEIPVDPGLRAITAEAPGYEVWSTDVTVLEKNVVEVSIPALTPLPEDVVDPPDEPIAPQTPDRADDGGTQRTIGLVVGGVGIASFAAAGVFALLILERQGFADDPARCPEPSRCTPEGIDAIDTARGYATFATVFTIAGAVLVTAGAVVFLTAPADEPATAGFWIAPSWTPGQAGVRAGAAF